MLRKLEINIVIGVKVLIIVNSHIILHHKHEGINQIKIRKFLTRKPK